MEVERAKEIIFQKLCKEYKRHGDNAHVSRWSLPEELEIPSDVFAEAMEAFVGIGGGLLIELDKDNDYIKLGPFGIARCKES